MSIRCLIVDDEPLAIKVLETHIENIPSLIVTGSCYNAFDAVEYLKKHEMLRTLRFPPKVIFTTAYREYAVDAFELEAVDYLVKPITLERLLKAVNKLTPLQTVAVKEDPRIVENEGFVYFRADRKMIKVSYNEILYIESMKDYVKIVRENEKPLLVKQPISSVEEALPASLFVRIHRSYIVSLQKITAFTSHDVEIGGIEIPIGRLYAHQFEKSGKTV
jgi:DNA-binding LytR/AlgR family response regulator